MPRRPTLVAKTHTEPLAGYLHPAFHPFAREELVRARAIYFQGTGSEGIPTAPFHVVSVMEDLISKCCKQYRVVGEPLRFWTTNLEAEMLQREIEVPERFKPDASRWVHAIVKLAIENGLNVLGEIATASNPVVDRVELLAYNKARANNRAAVKRSETWLKNWTEAHGSDAAAVAREENTRKRQAALVEFKAVSARLKEACAHVGTVERSQLKFGWENPLTRNAMRRVSDLMALAMKDSHAVSPDPKQCREWIVSKWNVCKGLLTTERGVAAKSRDRVWEFVDAVTKNQTWLKNETARMDSERTKLRATRMVLREPDPQTDPDQDSTRAALNWCEELVLSTEARLKRLRELTAAGDKRLKQLDNMSSEETQYLARLDERIAACDKWIVFLRQGAGGGDDDDDDDRVEVVSEKTWAQRDAEARAAVVEID